ncbi:MAG: OsmC family protein, partial [bacterium]
GSSLNPGWFFRASLAACCSTIIASRAARLGIDLTELEVKVVGEGNHRGMLGLDKNISAGHSALRTDVRVSARNASAEQLRELVIWAEEHSPVGRTVRDAPENTLTIEIV